MLDGTGGLDTGTLLTTILVAVLCVLVALAVPTIFFMLTLQRALSRCAPSSRTMTPRQVWIGAVPFVSLVWTFLLVNALAESLHNEFVRRGMVEEPAPGRSIGLAYAVLSLLCAVPLVNFVAGIPAVVCWILYWTKIAEYSGKIAGLFVGAGA